MPVLADARTLVVTAADDRSPSFGCGGFTRYTYFGDAFVNQALRQTGSLTEAYRRALGQIEVRERREGFNPSRPQFAGGKESRAKLQALEQGLRR